MEQRLSGKVAVVTGAGQGIGRGIALRLSGEGAQVVIADFNAATASGVAAEIDATGQRAMPYVVDVSDVSAIARMIDEVVIRWGRIDILINNAGAIQTKPMLELTAADWDRVVDVNQRGTFFCIQAAAQQMIRQAPQALQDAAQKPADVLNLGKSSTQVRDTPEELQASYGKIINLSSIAGRRGRALQTHYAATKAAIISLTQSAALALAPYRINVNAICPGIVPTPMWKQIDEDRGRLFGARPGEAMASFISTVPLKRAATPADIAAAVAFFCAADADYITGQTLNVDGGYEMD